MSGMNGMKRMNGIGGSEGLKAMKSVYCFCPKDVFDLTRDVYERLPHEMYKVTGSARKVNDAIRDMFEPALEVPSTPEGYVDLDSVHVPIIERIAGVYSKQVPGLRDFKYAYPTPGSSEGIFKLLAKNKADAEAVGRKRPIYVLEGEYEGYGEYAGSDDLKLDVRKVAIADSYLLSLPERGMWFISNPSARDGNILPDGFVNSICDSGHEAVVDLAYAGATRPNVFDVGNENVSAALLSFSKPYGVFRERIGGFVFSREPIHSLYGNRWFKDVPAMFQALALAEKIGPSGLYERYRPAQLEIVKEINDLHGLGIRPSDSFLLGYMTADDACGLGAEQMELIRPYARGDGFRFCLTPYFEELEMEEMENGMENGIEQEMKNNGGY